MNLLSRPGSRPDGGSGARAVLFDLDGTLVDTGPDIAAAINRMLADMEKPAYPTERILEWAGEGAALLVQRALAGGLDDRAPAGDCERGLALFQEHYANAVCVHSKPYPHVLSTLYALHQSGFGLGCVTNKPEHLSRLLLDSLDMTAFFGVVVGGDTLDVRKPHPEPLHYACRRLNVRPADTVYVGDSMTDCHAAAAAGVSMVAVTYGYNRGADLTATSCGAMIDGLGDLPETLKRMVRA